MLTGKVYVRSAAEGIQVQPKETVKGEEMRIPSQLITSTNHLEGKTCH